MIDIVSKLMIFIAKKDISYMLYISSYLSFNLQHKFITSQWINILNMKII